MSTVSQTERIKKRLEEHGYVTRNQMLANFITRGAARIDNLRNQGMEIEGEWIKTNRGKDYRYTLVGDFDLKHQRDLALFDDPEFCEQD